MNLIDAFLLNEEMDIGDYISDGGEWQVECFNRGERDTPHVHIITPKRKYSAPRLDIAEYFIHENKRYIMNSKEKKDFEEFMNDISRFDKNLTNWQFCVKRWNLTQPSNKQLSFDLKDKPNYLQL